MVSNPNELEAGVRPGLSYVIPPRKILDEELVLAKATFQSALHGVPEGLIAIT